MGPGVNHFCLVQAVAGLSQGVVVAVTPATHRRLDASFRQPLGIANADLLRAPIGVIDETSIAFGLLGIQGLLQRIKYEVRAHRAAHPPANNAMGEDVDDKGQVEPTLPGRDVGEVAEPPRNRGDSARWRIGGEAPP